MTSLCNTPAACMSFFTCIQGLLLVNSAILIIVIDISVALVVLVLQQL